jgi:uncharacterized membrane protein YgdD (TMEM256/DUF423 family)
MNRSINAAALFGASAVACGAFGAHGLKSFLDAYSLSIWQTAVLYQFIHALALMALSLAPAHTPWRLSFWAWGLGTLLFSGSLYALALGAPSVLGAITPVGGIALMVGWINAWRLARNHSAMNSD